MEVILRVDYPLLGFMGDKVKVKDGFARNFLFPKGIAVESSSSGGRFLKHIMDGLNAKKAKKKLEAQDLAKRIEEIKLDFVLKLGEQGKSFGSVTAHDIELGMKAKGFEIERRQIRLHEAIKSGGTFPVQIKLHSEVTASLEVVVKFDIPEAPKAAAQKGGKKGESRRKKDSAVDATTETEVKAEQE